MSVLKATTAQEIVRNEKDCDYMDELFGGVKMPPTQVYLKSEADKVIAEKDKEIAEKDKEIARQNEVWNRLCKKYNKFVSLKQEFCEKFKDIELEIDK